jgi:hypothetical protein
MRMREELNALRSNAFILSLGAGPHPRFRSPIFPGLVIEFALVFHNRSAEFSIFSDSGIFLSCPLGKSVACALQ